MPFVDTCLPLGKEGLTALQAHRASGDTRAFSRAELLAWTFVRGLPHARAEPRVSENHLPPAKEIAAALSKALGHKGPHPRADVDALVRPWCDVPSERIRHYGPRDKATRAKRPACLYLVVRGDLSPAQQAVQAAHALQQFNVDHPEIAKVWTESSNALSFLAVPAEADLERLAAEGAEKGVAVSVFREPDDGNRLTAIAIEPRGKGLCRKLPLALAP